MLPIQFSCHLIHSIHFFDFFITVVSILFIRSANKAFTTASFRGYSRFKVTWMIKWEQKSKAQKIPGPKINPPKNPIHNYAAGIRGQTTNNNDQLNQAIQEKFCHFIFLSYPKKIPKSKILNPKYPSIKPVTWNPEYHWGFVPPNFLIKSLAYDVLHNSKTDCRKRSWIGETYK